MSLFERRHRKPGMKLDAVFFNLIPRVDRDTARLNTRTVSSSDSCLYAESHPNIPPAWRTIKNTTPTIEMFYSLIPICHFLLHCNMHFNFVLSFSKTLFSIFKISPFLFLLSRLPRLKMFSSYFFFSEPKLPLINVFAFFLP